VAERILKVVFAPRHHAAHELGIVEISIIAGRHVGHQLGDCVVRQILLALRVRERKVEALHVVGGDERALGIREAMVVVFIGITETIAWAKCCSRRG
jgi:hypothetical protein